MKVLVLLNCFTGVYTIIGNEEKKDKNEWYKKFTDYKENYKVKDGLFNLYILGKSSDNKKE